LAGGGGVVHTLTLDDGSDVGQIRSRMGCLFATGNSFVLSLFLPDLVGVNSWANSVRYAFIDDGAAGNKLYFERVNPADSVVVAADDVWSLSSVAQVAYKPGFAP
jgi:hypothetical protein